MLISTDTGAHARTSVVWRCRSPGGDRVPVRGRHPERVGSDLVSFRLSGGGLGAGLLVQKRLTVPSAGPDNTAPTHTPHTLPTMAAALSSTASISGACRLAPPARAGQVSVEWTERERRERKRGQLWPLRIERAGGARSPSPSAARTSLAVCVTRTCLHPAWVQATRGDASRHAGARPPATGGGHGSHTRTLARGQFRGPLTPHHSHAPPHRPRAPWSSPPPRWCVDRERRKRGEEGARVRE